MEARALEGMVPTQRKPLPTIPPYLLPPRVVCPLRQFRIVWNTVPTPIPLFPNHHTAACRRLIRLAYAPLERIPLIEAILSSKVEEEVIRSLTLPDAQIFVDAINEARLHFPRHRMSHD